MIEIWGNSSTEIQVALIAAVVSVFTAILTLVATFILTPLGQYLIGKRELRHRLSTEYEYEQRKQLSNTINRYRGLILNSADLMKSRIFNLYVNEKQRWLKVREKKDGQGQNSKDYRGTGYYFTTTVYRFLAVSAAIQRFENEALYIDPKIAEKEDFDFVYGLKLLQRVATDTSLFKGTDYDQFKSTDHIFSDTLRKIADSCWSDDRFVTREGFESLMGEDRDLDTVLEYFDDLKANETRFRWDRLVAFHLLLVAFINTFGYRFQCTTEDKLRDIVERLEHDVIGANLLKWLNEYEPFFGQSVYGENVRTISKLLRERLGETVGQ